MQKKIILGLWFLFLIPSFTNASPVARYAYFREIQNTNTEEIIFRFPTESFGKINQLLNTIKVTGADFQSINYQAEFVSLGPLSGENVTKKILNQPQENPQLKNLWDADWTTEITIPTDPNTNTAIIELEFPVQTPISQIQIIPHKDAKIESWELATSKTENKFSWKANQKPFVSEDGEAGIFTLKSPMDAKKLQIKLWGENIQIKDLEIYQAPILQIKFTQNGSPNYHIFYASDTQAVLYNKLTQKKISSLSPINATLSPEKINPDLFPDIDDDSIPNEKDNCPLASNPNQADSDKDFIGDVCDNARTKTNFNQMDIDFDGIGDIEDPCLWSKNKLLLVGATGFSPDYCTQVIESQPTDHKTPESESKKPVSPGLIYIFAFFILFVLFRFFSREK